MIEERKRRLLKDSKVFCMAPWTNLFIDSWKDVKPCDAALWELPAGNLRESRLDRVLNSDNLRRMRLNMLNGVKSPECSLCYEKDTAGVSSLRREFNAKFASEFPVVESTRKDGSLESPGWVYLDVCFSNLCNFRCRYCDSSRSTAWAHDEELWLGDGMRKPGAAPRQPVHDDLEGTLEQLEPHLPGLKHIHFMGGEPLLMDEHYKLLKLLIEKRLFHVELCYNTNFSVTQYKGQDVMELWNLFERVTVGASLDAMGRRSEYIRKGQKWDQVMRNRERMLKVCPQVRFDIAPVISVFNALHFPDFYMDWVRRGFLDSECVVPGFALHPDFYCAQILPKHLKALAIAKYEECIREVIRPRGLPEESAGYARGGGALRMIQDFLRARDLSALLPRFVERNRRLDEIRGERFIDVFPELAELYEDAPARVL